ncbi:THAP domain-containing protein 5-like isoform X2 [Hetaerina americana]|uniref:THAP domain-containing protein 5-like isoform X2 n=1 Tax=Hetaerina americana TaxID=62018 RepID=UPI003A7F2249
MNCQAFGCENRIGNAPKKIGLSYHRFPKNDYLRKCWERVVGGENWTAPPGAILCSAHFEPDNFDKSGKLVKLNKGAIPSIFPNSERNDHLRIANAMKKLTQNSNMKFMENFDPETSNREKRKLSRKFNAGGKKQTTDYDDKGCLTACGKDICDCMEPECPGCHFPCYRCQSPKCGHECRVNRKYVYECIDIEGTPKELSLEGITVKKDS